MGTQMSRRWYFQLELPQRTGDRSLKYQAGLFYLAEIRHFIHCTLPDLVFSPKAGGLQDKRYHSVIFHVFCFVFLTCLKGYDSEKCCGNILFSEYPQKQPRKIQFAAPKLTVDCETAFRCVPQRSLHTKQMLLCISSTAQ